MYSCYSSGGLASVLQSGPVVLMCMRKVPWRLADRWGCHSGEREGLILAELTLVISEGPMDEKTLQK